MRCIRLTGSTFAWVALLSLSLSGCSSGNATVVGDGGTPGTVGVSLSPTEALTTPGGTVSFVAAVTGSSNRSVTWSLRAPGAPQAGTISSSGVYAAPASSGAFTVVATSVADPSKSATATVTVSDAATLPANRTTVLQPGVTYNGGIPSRPTICATVSPSGDTTGAMDQQAITAAIDGCPSGQTVKLATGNFYTGTLIIKSNITVRGTTDANGRPITRFLRSGTNGSPTFSNVNMGSPSEGTYVQPNALTADAPQGSYSVQVAQNPGYVAGELVTLNQVYDNTIWYNVWHFGQNSSNIAVNSPLANVPITNGVGDPATAENPGPETIQYANEERLPNQGPSGDTRSMFSAWNRPIGQVLEIQSVTGDGPYTITFSTPLHADFTTILQAQIVRHAYWGTPATVITQPDQWFGIEDVYAEGDGPFVGFINSKYCWVKNVEVFDWGGYCINFIRCFRCEERDSYLHQTQNPNPGGGGYALAIDWQSADNLIENNIHWGANKVIVMRASGGGNVVAYNYFEDGFGAGYPTIPEAGLNASHFLGSHMEFFEGNQSWNLHGDGVWGNSLGVVFFRNYATGLRRNVPGVTSVGSTGAPMDFDHDSGGRVAAYAATYHLNYTYMDNVLGAPDAPSPSVPWAYETTSLDLTLPAIWAIGPDQGPLGATQEMLDRTKASTLRHGNWDYGYTNGVVWDPDIPQRAFPSSLYLSNPPAFWSTWKGQQGTGPYGGAWPWLDGTSGATHTLPAKAAFDAMLQAGTLYCTGPGMPTPCCRDSTICQ